MHSIELFLHTRSIRTIFDLLKLVSFTFSHDGASLKKTRQSFRNVFCVGTPCEISSSSSSSSKIAMKLLQIDRKLKDTSRCRQIDQIRRQQICKNSFRTRHLLRGAPSRSFQIAPNKKNMKQPSVLRSVEK